jgi:hypothetical protein
MLVSAQGKATYVNVRPGLNWDIWNVKHRIPGSMYVASWSADRVEAKTNNGEWKIVVEWGGTPETSLPVFNAAMAKGVEMHGYMSCLLNVENADLLSIRVNHPFVQRDRDEYTAKVTGGFRDLPLGATIKVEPVNLTELTPIR